MDPLVARLPFALLGAVPALVVMLLVDRFDAARPEPRWLLRRVTLLGALTVVPVLGVELLLLLAGIPLAPHTIVGAATSAFVLAALPEETGKAACLLWVARRRVELDARTDGIVYGARAGLGFALVENVGYSLMATDIREFVVLFVARALLSVPTHATWAGIMGYFTAKRRIDGRGPGLLGGLAIAIAGHGAFDFGLQLASLADARADRELFVVGAALTLGTAALGVLLLRALARRARAEDDASAGSRDAG
jgi:protease PrsW